jgi:hypothetical protein
MELLLVTMCLHIIPIMYLAALNWAFHSIWPTCVKFTQRQLMSCQQMSCQQVKARCLDCLIVCGRV